MLRLALAIGLLASSARAAVPGLTLSWSAPQDCPTREQLENAIARQLGDDTTAPNPPLVVSGDVALVEGAWRVLLRNASGGERTLTGSTCRAVSSAAVVVIVLMVDPFATPEVAPVVLDEPTPSPSGSSVGVAALLDTSSLPKLTSGVALLGSLGLPAGFALELQGHAWWPQFTVADAPGATFWLFTGSLGARRDFELSDGAVGVALAPVLSVEAGALRGKSYGVTNPAENVGFWLAPRAGAALLITYGVLRLGLRVEAVVPLTRPRFFIEGVGDVHTSPFISGRGALSVELRFPPRNTTPPATKERE